MRLIVVRQVFLFVWFLSLPCFALFAQHEVNLQILDAVILRYAESGTKDSFLFYSDQKLRFARQSDNLALWGWTQLDIHDFFSGDSEKALEQLYDLVLSDIAMPEMDGMELCRRLKTNILTSHVPIVLLTARTSLVHTIEGLETGADDYITKPFNLQLLRLRIRNLIAVRERLKEQSGKSLELSPSAITVNSIDEEFLQKFISLIEAHIDESEYSIDDLAHQIAMSRMQLYRKLKALTGETPNTLIRNIRLQRAAQLLDTRQFNISEVAYKVGFTDLKYFRERFKERFGVVPSEYKG